MEAHSFRIVTYNVHKCRGLDRRVRPQRIVAVLRETAADIIALQEVLSIEGSQRERDQARFIGEELGLHYYLRRTKLLEFSYGDAAFHRERVLAATLQSLGIAS